jgi:hypothetical protein
MTTLQTLSSAVKVATDAATTATGQANIATLARKAIDKANTEVAANAGAVAAAAAVAVAINNRIYPGLYNVDPVERPDGSAIQDGDVCSLVSGVMRVRIEGAWQDWTTASAAAAAADASDASDSAGEAADSATLSSHWATQTGADVTGQPAGSRSAKSWSQDNLTPTGANLGGSAKDWAQSADLPDGVNKSAKGFAADAAAAKAGIDNRIYPGTFAVAPVTRPDGSAIQGGDVYFDANTLAYRWNGAAWVASDINTANLAASTGDSLLGTVRADAGAVAQTQQDINREVVRITAFLTPQQRTAMRTNNWAGVDITAFTAAVQAAIYAAQFKELVIPTPAWLKVNRPLVWREYTTIRGQGLPAKDLGVNIYPDLSVDWHTLYPDQGVLTADKYLFGDPNYPAITAGFWTGVGKNLHLRPDLDAANYAAFRSRVPDYGIVIWCPNESVLMEHVQALNFQKANWMCGGTSSVPTFLHCVGMSAGNGQNTTFGDAVTRPAAPFGAAVTVYFDVGNDTTLTLEAATNTDLDTLAPGDSLTINGTAYNVAALATATTAINERTVIGGVVTTARFYRRVTLGAAANFNGRIFPAGISFRNHPKLTFAPGVAAALGGRGNGGSARLFGFSGDSNSALIYCSGGQSLVIVGPKSEGNNSLLHWSGSNLGGGRGHAEISGYRADGFGTFDSGLIRITGKARPSIVAGTGQVVGYSLIMNDQTLTGGAEQLTTASLYGQGFLCYCRDGSEIASFGSIRTNGLIIGDGNTNVPIADWIDGSDTTRRMRWACSNTTEAYRFSVGAANNNVLTVGSSTGSNTYLWAYNGAATEKLLRLYNVSGAAAVMIGQNAAQRVSFFGASPVTQQASAPAATDAASTQTLANALRTALLNLGLIA